MNDDRVEAVLRILGGEPVVGVAAELAEAADTVEAWRQTFIEAGRSALASAATGEGLVTRRVIPMSEVIGQEIYPDRFVWWDSIRGMDIDAFQAAVDSARREEDVQRYLAANPLMLVQPLGGGHGRWVLPKVRLGSQFVTDFIVGDRDSTGYSWIAVELESPRASMFTRSGDESRALRHAFRQIEDWRSWLTNNQPYARSPSADNGLNLPDITPTLRGWVIIGRRRDTPPGFDARRRQWRDTSNIEVHTYDWLIERAQGRVHGLAASH